MSQLSVGILQQLQRTRDASFDQALARLGIGAALDPRTKVSWSHVCTVLESKLREPHDPCLALRAGLASSTWALPGLGVVMMSAPTMRQMFGALSRFAPLLLSGLEFSVVESGARAEVHFVLPPCSSQVEQLAVEFLLAFSTHVSRELCPPSGAGLARGFVRHARPAHADLYRGLLGFPVSFAADRNGFDFAANELDLPLGAGDPVLFSLLCAQAESALLSQHELQPAALLVKQLLRTADFRDLTLQSIAKQLKLGEAVLQRKLRSEGTHFSQLVDEVRRELALPDVVRAATSMKELAERLGFSEPSPFYRAFRRWTGQTPQQYRAAHGLR